MIRIKTLVDTYKVYTLWVNNKWVTILSSIDNPKKKPIYYEATSLEGAGRNHLEACAASQLMLP